MIFKNDLDAPIAYDVAVPADYGDNITTGIQGSYKYGLAGGATPNVTVSYSPGANIYTFGPSYGNLASVIYTNGSGGNFTITFTAEAGYEVRLTSFNLAGYQEGARTLGSVTVSNGTNTYTQNNLTHDGSESSTAVDFSGGLTAAIGEVVTLSFTGASDLIGFSDFQFSQVPGPGPDFSVTITPNASEVGNYDFSWNTQNGKLYDLVSSTDLATAPSTWDVWQENLDIPGNGGIYILSNVDGGDNTKRFFAVRQKTPTP